MPALGYTMQSISSPAHHWLPSPHWQGISVGSNLRRIEHYSVIAAMISTRQEFHTKHVG